MRTETLELLTVDEVTQLLKLSKGAVYQMIARREIPYLKMGRRVRFDKTEISTWINKQRVKEYIPEIN